MFTGLVERVGTVLGLERAGDGARMRVDAGDLCRELRTGESISVDGTCLTVVRAGNGWFEIDISPETLRRTVAGERAAGSRVNLERAVRAGDRLGGHLVQGHVDGVGRVKWVREEGNGRRIRVEPPNGLQPYLVEKGSVALDGVSLTVAALDREGFEVALIPLTLAGTTLGEWVPKRRMNVEVDLVAKYVERLLETGRAAPAASAADRPPEEFPR